MKKIIPIFLLITLIVCCKKTANEETPEKVTETPLEKVVQDQTIKAGIISADSLKALAGQYPSNVRFLELPIIKNSLMKIMKSDYKQLNENWNVETPIQIDNNILSTSGCKKNACPDDLYLLYFNLENYNMNVYNFKKNKLTLYPGEGKIELPRDLLLELEIMKSNSSIIEKEILTRHE